jgi:hypothetical protein
MSALLLQSASAAARARTGFPRSDGAHHGSWQLIEAVLAALKLAAAYVPLDREEAVATHILESAPRASSVRGTGFCWLRRGQSRLMFTSPRVRDDSQRRFNQGSGSSRLKGVGCGSRGSLGREARDLQRGERGSARLGWGGEVRSWAGVVRSPRFAKLTCGRMQVEWLGAGHVALRGSCGSARVMWLGAGHVARRGSCGSARVMWLGAVEQVDEGRRRGREVERVDEAAARRVLPRGTRRTIAPRSRRRTGGTPRCRAGDSARRPGRGTPRRARRGR